MATRFDEFELPLRPSPALCCVELGVHGLAFISLSLAGVSLALKLALGFAVIVSTVFALRSVLLLAPDSVVNLRYRKGLFTLTLANGDERVVNVGSPRIVLHFVSLLKFFDDAGRVYFVPVLRDNTSSETFRRFRVLLRFI